MKWKTLIAALVVSVAPLYAWQNTRPAVSLEGAAEAKLRQAFSTVAGSSSFGHIDLGALCFNQMRTRGRFSAASARPDRETSTRRG